MIRVLLEYPNPVRRNTRGRVELVELEYSYVVEGHLNEVKRSWLEGKQ